MEESLLAQIMAHSVSPVVMVLSTSLAEAACRKNSLSFVDLVRPFCGVLDINVPVRTASETPYRLQEFQLRLFHASEIRQISTEAAEAHLLEVVTDASDVALDELGGDPRQLEAVQKMVQRESISSWYQQYSIEFIKSLAFSEHEGFDHPVACLLVISSKDENPLSSFAELFNAENLPALMKNGAMDPKILKHYVVLHDNQEGDTQRANELLQEIGGTFGINECRLLCINSRSPDDLDPVDDVWSKHPKLVNSGKLGCCLLNRDLDEIQDFVLDVCQKHIIPCLEQKVRVLNQQVLATRKGFRNQIKNLWWRKKESEVPETSAVYTYMSMESQIRLLADYAFMLRDYELAVSNYRLVSSDYKADKALKRYAGATEMIGICLCLLDQSRREADSSLETAYVTYQMCGPPSTRYATRTAMWWAEVHKSRGQYREAAYVLFKAATEMDKDAILRAGVLLEQSAYCYLRCAPPMSRKFGFHLVLAGVRYHLSGQRKHAIRAYTSVMSVYDGQGWQFINDHLNSYLGRISSLMGRQDDAVSHFMSLVTSNRQSASNQALFFREFLGAVQSSDAKDKVLRVGLPEINSQHVVVQFEDHRTYASSAAASLPEDSWLKVEDGLIPSAAVPLSTWLDGPKSQKQDDFNVCVSGEDVTVSFDVSNSLQIPIEVAGMELICEFEPKKVSSTDGHGSLLLSSETFALQGGEKTKIFLKVRPSEEGLLKIVGVKWILCGSVHGRYDFVVPRKQKKTKSRRTTVETPPYQRLKFHVAGHMPKLEVSLHELPNKVNTGEIRRLVLEIQNPSNAPIKNIKLKASHPEFVMVGEQGDLDHEFPKCLELRGGKEESAYRDHRSSIFSFPQDTALEAGSTFLWPLWLHARRAGELSLRMAVYFEGAESSSSLRYRTLRMSHSLQIVPSLDVSVHISPSPMKLDVYLLRMDVANVHPSESFWIRQASCAQDGWYLSAVQPQLLQRAGDDDETTTKAAFLTASVSPSQLLPAAQTSSFFFQVQRSAESHLSRTESGCNVGLGPSSSNEPLIDIHSGPIHYFHQQERQASLSKDLEGHFVDIVLIAEQQDEIVSNRPAALQNSTRFASHHVCHCRLEGRVPLVWALQGPSCLEHDFAKEPVCEVSFMLALRNCSRAKAVVKVETLDSILTTTVEGAEPSAGWRSASPPPSLEALSSPSKARAQAQESRVTPCGPYLWCGSKSVTKLQVEAGSCVKVPLRVALFSAGTYDICSYRISYNLLPQQSSKASEPVAATIVKQQKSRFIAAPVTASSNLVTAGSGPGTIDALHSDGDALGDVDVTSISGHPFLLSVLRAR